MRKFLNAKYSQTTVCAQCYPVLSRHADTFKDMVHQGTELKKKKKINPYPKRPESELVHYCDITKQNEWLRENVFDSLGNYLYFCSCIRASLEISKDRIAHQRIHSIIYDMANSNQLAG